MNALKHYKLFRDGEFYQQEFVKLINGAKVSIVLQTYIFDGSEFGKSVKTALIEKAKQGISISILIDYFGSYSIPDEFLLAFKNEKNINFLFFNPIRLPRLFLIGRRLHHKILIIDSSVAIIGGINITNCYDHYSTSLPRLDFAIRIESPIVKNIEKYCICLNQKIESEVDQKFLIFNLPIQNWDLTIWVNDWFKGRKQITNSYLRMLIEAKSQIILIHGYFFPSRKVLKVLKKKIYEGLDVKIILPRFSDWPTWTWATSFLYSDLIYNGIKVYEWRMSNLHGKMALIDQEVLSLGSHNLNYTSSFGNLEMNVEIKDKDFCKRINQEIIIDIFSGSEEVTLYDLDRLGILKRLRNFVMYALLKLISITSINYMKLGLAIRKLRIIHKHDKNHDLYK